MRYLAAMEIFFKQMFTVPSFVLCFVFVLYIKNTIEIEIRKISRKYILFRNRIFHLKWAFCVSLISKRLEKKKQLFYYIHYLTYPQKALDHKNKRSAQLSLSIL